MRPHMLPGCSVLAAVMLHAAGARAGGGAATDAYAGVDPSVAVDPHAMVDVYEQASLVAPWLRSTALRAFDDHEGTPRAGLVRLTLAHAPEVFGFRVDADVGDTADAFRDLDPAASAHPGLARGLSYLEQAFVTAVVPVGPGVALDVGKFQTPVGLEDNEAELAWNYSRAFLFTLAEPTYHTGARATVQATDTLAFSAFWLDGWNTNLVDGNHMRDFGAAVTWHPVRGVEAVADYVGGPERAITRLADPTLRFRSVLDAYVTLALADALSFSSTGDVGRDAAGGGATWWGFGGSLRWRLLPWLATAVRGEYYDDGDGFTSGARQRLTEGTFTVETRQHLHKATVVTRVEYRRDQSDIPFFAGGSATPLAHQDTLTWSLLTAL